MLALTGVVRYGPFNQKKLYSADFITAMLDKGFAIGELLWYLKVGRQVVGFELTLVVIGRLYR
jgi:hypothetical protein